MNFFDLCGQNCYDQMLQEELGKINGQWPVKEGTFQTILWVVTAKHFDFCVSINLKKEKTRTKY